MTQHQIIIKWSAMLAMVFWTGSLQAQNWDQNIRGSLGVEGDWSWVTTENYWPVLNRIKELRSEGDIVRQYGNQIDGALIALNDEETVQKYLDVYHKNGRDNIIQFYGHEQAVIDLAPDLFLPPQDAHVDIDVEIPCIRNQSMGLLARAVNRSTSFSEETRVWAKRSGYFYNPPAADAAAKLWQAWWEHNKEAILAHRFKDATWLPSAAEPKREEQHVSLPLNQPSPSPAPKPAPPTPQPSPPVDTSIPILLYTIIGLSIAALIGGWQLFKPKK